MILALVLSCTSAPTDSADPVAACIATAPTFDGDAADADAVTTTCEAEGGASCDSALWFGSDAATCIATLEGLAAGIEDWTASIVYHATLGVVWNVSSTTSRDGGGGATGEVVSIDAVTGAASVIYQWESTP